MEKFDKTKYDMDYRKKHKSQFNVDINKEEKDEIDALLKNNGMTKTDFLRNAIRKYKSETTSIRVYIYMDKIVFTKDDENGEEYMTEAFYINEDKYGNECVSINILDIIDTILNINNNNIIFINKRNEKYDTKKAGN